VFTILRGRIRSTALSGAWCIDTTPIDLKASQIVVGISIAIDIVLELPDESPIIPAVLDTGLNHNFSIHQYHLEEGAKLPKQTLAHHRTKRDQINAGHQYDVCYASLWLHRYPFELIDRIDLPRPWNQPVFLGKASEMIVYQYKDNQRAKHIVSNDVFPRLPCLGLKALTENRLRFFVDGERERSRFRISRSFTSWLYPNG